LSSASAEAAGSDVSLAYLSQIATTGRLYIPRKFAIGAMGAAHLLALGLMVFTESGVFASLIFVLTWTALNAIFLALVARPAVAASLSIALFALLIALSQLKFSVLWMVINFFDILIVDSDTFSFLFSVVPGLRIGFTIVLLLAVGLFLLIWWGDQLRVPRLPSLAVAAGSAAVIAVMALKVPEEPWEQFQGVNHISTFVRSGVSTAYEISTKGWIDFDSTTSDRLRLSSGEFCNVSEKPPNIILMLDEASFDASAVRDIKLPAGYGSYFRSFDGHSRSTIVEGSGGPTWYTEYNVLTGLSARSYGRLSYYVTRIAAGRVKRGLAQALKRCGYKTITQYPAYGAFLSARKFQETTGIAEFNDATVLKPRDVENDGFYFNKAAETIAKERGDQPLFMFVYTMFNHFPWWYSPRPELTPDWKPLGNDPEVDEYLRRQSLTAREYAEFKARLARELPGEQFLIVRFGDHQPGMAKVVDPSATDDEVGQRIMAHDPRYFTTYYAIDTINFQPKDLSSALEKLEAPYIPLVVQEAAGLPLDATFVEQKKILERCHGLFYDCAGGAEARRFNTLLIDAGLIQGMVSR
jgi:hypothetical protein